MQRWHGTHVFDRVRFADSNRLAFGDAQDIYLTWDGTNLTILPVTDDVGAVYFGNGTVDMDVRVTLGASTTYWQFDVGLARLVAAGTDVSMWMGSLANTAGSGTAMTAARTRAMGVYVDDGDAAIASSVFARAGVFRHLLTYTGGNREQEAAGVVGQIVSVAGTNRHNMCGVMGSYEAQTSLTVDGQASSTDPWIQAGVIGRVGVGTAITTINANGILAGLAAMSNTASFSANSGVYAGLYVGRWGSNADFGYGIYLENVDVGIQFAHTLVPDSTRTNMAIGIGSRATEKDVTMASANSQHLDPIQMNLNVIGVIPTSTSTLNGFYMQLTHDTTAMTGYLRLKGCDWTATIAKNLQDVYIFQGEIDFTAATTVGGEAAGMGLTVSTGATSVVTGNVWGAIIVTSFTSTVSVGAGLFLSHRVGTLTHSLYIECSASATITDAIYVNDAGTITNFIKFAGTTSGVVATASGGATRSHKITCDVGGIAYYMSLYTD